MVTLTRLDGVAFTDPEAGRIVVSPNSEVAVPGQIQQLSGGVAFGPLAVVPEAGRTVEVTRLDFPGWSDPGDVGASPDGHLAGAAAAGLLAGAAAGASHLRGDRSGESGAAKRPSLNRRRFLASSSALLGGAGVGAQTAGARDNPGKTAVDVEVGENSGGFYLGVLGATDDGWRGRYDVHLNGRQIGTLAAPSVRGLRVPAGESGRITLRGSDDGREQ